MKYLTYLFLVLNLTIIIRTNAETLVPNLVPNGDLTKRVAKVMEKSDDILDEAIKKTFGISIKEIKVKTDKFTEIITAMIVLESAAEGSSVLVKNNALLITNADEKAKMLLNAIMEGVVEEVQKVKVKEKPITNSCQTLF